MVKKLAERGLAIHEPYHGVRLTPAGERLALEMIRHHRLLELYLAEHLDVPWDRVHEEAEALEHVLSEFLEARIAAKLGHPTHDPHGDPIPDHDLVIDEGQTEALDSLPVGAGGRFVRVSDADPEMLRYLAERGIAIGDRVRGLRPPAVRRADDRALRRRRARARRDAGARHAHRAELTGRPRRTVVGRRSGSGRPRVVAPSPARSSRRAPGRVAATRRRAAS